MTEKAECHCLTIYLAIFHFMRDNGYAPTHLELAALSGIAWPRIEHYLRLLRKEGLIENPRHPHHPSLARRGVRNLRLAGVALAVSCYDEDHWRGTKHRAFQRKLAGIRRA